MRARRHTHARVRRITHTFETGTDDDDGDDADGGDDADDARCGVRAEFVVRDERWTRTVSRRGVDAGGASTCEWERNVDDDDDDDEREEEEGRGRGESAPGTYS